MYFYFALNSLMVCILYKLICNIDPLWIFPPTNPHYIAHLSQQIKSFLSQAPLVHYIHGYQDFLSLDYHIDSRSHLVKFHTFFYHLDISS